MKLTINKGVRESISELEKLFDQFDALGRTLSDRNLPPSIASDMEYERKSIESQIVSCGAKILSHATRGRRYPNMTDYRNPDWMI